MPNQKGTFTARPKRASDGAVNARYTKTKTAKLRMDEKPDKKKADKNTAAKKTTVKAAAKKTEKKTAQKTDAKKAPVRRAVFKEEPQKEITL